MTSAPTLSLSWPEADIALLTFDTPDKRANVLSASVLQELQQHLDDLAKRDDVAGLIIISGKPGMFIAGADLTEFAKSQDARAEQVEALCRQGQQLFGRLSAAPFVSVAAIDGVCLGGGAELTLWCDRRVVSNSAKTAIGLPEVKVGLFPGWGGTARLPRMVGLSNAVEMITGGESVDSQTAFKMGLADDIVPAEQLQAAAVELVRRELASRSFEQSRQQWQQPIEMSPTELGFLGATASAVILGQTKGQYPAPMAALELMLESAGEPLEKACQMEAQKFPELFGTPVNTSLLNVFFLTDRNKKDRGVDRPNVTPRDVTTVGVLGAGIMGAGIAAANIKRQVPVVLADASQDALRRGARKVIEEAAYDRNKKAPDAAKAVALSPLLNLGDDPELVQCDIVIEAVVENADVKKQVFARLEPAMKPDAILASNTSTIPITDMAQGLRRPEQFCGLHFFNPVRRMKLVEVIRGAKTSDETVATAVAYAKRVGKMPIVVNDGPGFLVNRLLFPYMNEALQLLTEGAAIKDIDRAATKFGMPMGPIALYDMVGLDTALLAGRVMWEAYPDRIAALPILPALVKQGRMGQKSGRGFFLHEGRKRPEVDPETESLLASYVKQRREHSPDELTARLFVPMLLEAARVLQEKLVRDVRDVDLGMIFGLGFPAFRGGLLFWADTVGMAQIDEMLQPLQGLGTRFEPPPLLQEMIGRGDKFYQS